MQNFIYLSILIMNLLKEVYHLKRIVTMLILLIILFINPLVSEGTGYVKEVNAKFYGLDIYIEGNKINSLKEPFIYEDTLWVPLSELARGLNMKYKLNINNKSIELDSNGKLKEDNNSSIIESFQLGYEVEAKERNMKSLQEDIYALEKGYNKEKPSLKDYVERSLKVYFGDVKIILDGEEIFLYNDPFYYNEEIYVSLMDISYCLYINPSLDVENTRITIDANGILIEKDYYKKIDQLIGYRKGRDYLLGIKIENLNKHKEMYKKLNLPFMNIANLDDLGKYLNRYLNTIEDLKLNIDLKRPYNKWIDLTFSFPRSEAYKWNRLQRKDVENYIWNVYSAILMLYDEEISIRGQILNPYYSNYSLSSEKYYVTFTTDDMDIDFDFSNSKLKKNYRIDKDYIEDELNNSLKKYGIFEFEYKAKESGYDVYLNIKVNRESFFTRSLYEKMGYLRRLNNEIRRIDPDLSVDGVIYYDKNSEHAIRFNIADNRISSSDLIEETESFLTGTYGSFSRGPYIFRMEYFIYETEENKFTLVVETSFSIEDNEWKKAGDEGKEILKNRIDSAISHTKSLWDVDDIKIEIYDKNGIEIPLDY